MLSPELELFHATERDERRNAEPRWSKTTSRLTMKEKNINIVGKQKDDWLIRKVWEGGGNFASVSIAMILQIQSNKMINIHKQK